MKSTGKKIVWVSPLILDSYLHKTSRLEILKNLSKSGNTVLLFGMRSKSTFKIRDDSSKFPKMIQVPLRSFPVIAPTMYAFILSLFLPLYIALFDPDFIIMEPDILVTASLSSIIVSKLKKTTFVLDIRSVPVELQGLRGDLTKLWFNISVLIAKRLFSGLTIITPMMKKEVCAKFSINPTRVGVWTSGVSTTLFDPDVCRTQGIELKAKLGLSGKFVVFYHGNLTSKRGITETIEAMEIITKKHSEVVLFLLGSGPFADNLKSFINQKNIQNVVVHDKVDYQQVPKFISMSDVCIMPLPDYPYWRSQSPLNLFEYLSMEKTIIATDLPAHRSVLDNQDCGIYLSSANPETIAKGIEFALINKDKLVEWGKIGRTLVLRYYTWKKVAEDLQSYLMSIT
jgi:glycosyltransferase involved in cell wall biosynthesis